MQETLTTTSNLTVNEAAAAGAVVGTMLSTIFISALIVYILTVIATWKIFQKAGEPGWKALIPIYNTYIMFKIVNMKGWFWFLFCSCIIASIIISVTGAPNVIVANGSQVVAYSWGTNPAALIAMIFEVIVAICAGIINSWRLSKVFGHGAGYFIGLIFLPFIFWLILGFGSSKYNKKNL